MATTIVPQSLPAIDAAIEWHESVLRVLRDARAILTAFNPAVNPRKYSGKSIAIALEEYLEDRGGIATREDCLSALLQGGCDMGGRPKANLGTVITRNPLLFEARGNEVVLNSLERMAA